MLYSLICSRTSKGLSLGELIRAFCIIIIASYKSSLQCYLHQSIIIYAFLDDFGDFPTKSLLLVFNFREAENLFFRILMFQGPYGTQKGRGFFWCQYFHVRSIWSTRITRGVPQGLNEAWWRDLPPDRATRARSLIEHRLSSILLWLAPYRGKTYAIIFLYFSEAEAEIFFHLGRGQILPPGCLQEGELAVSITTNPSLT